MEQKHKKITIEKVHHCMYVVGRMTPRASTLEIAYPSFAGEGVASLYLREDNSHSSVAVGVYLFLYGGQASLRSLGVSCPLVQSRQGHGQPTAFPFCLRFKW